MVREWVYSRIELDEEGHIHMYTCIYTCLLIPSTDSTKSLLLGWIMILFMNSFWGVNNSFKKKTSTYRREGRGQEGGGQEGRRGGGQEGGAGGNAIGYNYILYLVIRQASLKGKRVFHGIEFPCRTRRQRYADDRREIGQHCMRTTNDTNNRVCTEHTRVHITDFSQISCLQLSPYFHSK